MTVVPAPNRDVTGPLARALYQRLSAGLSVPVYDDVPTSATYPHVVIGESVSTSGGSHDRYGQRTVVALHVWSTYHGWQEAARIAGDVIGLTDRQRDLEIVGHHLVDLRLMQQTNLRDPDADLRHIALRVVATTEHLPEEN